MARSTALLLAGIIAVGVRGPALAESSHCTLAPQITESARIAVPATTERSGNGSRVMVMSLFPGWERDVRARYGFYAEAPGREPVPLSIEGPLSRADAERRFGE